MTTDTTTTKIVGRLATMAIAAGLGVVGLGVTPAAADAPAVRPFTVTFPDVNPCTGEEMEVTVTGEVREHLGHDGRYVARASTTGTTSDGYVMDHGRSNIVVNDNVVSSTLNDMWRDADGSRFQAQSHFLEKDGEFVVDGFRLRCITP